MLGQGALRAVALAALALALLAAPAAAQTVAPASTATSATSTTQADPNAAVPVPDMTKPPAGRRLAGTEVQRIAERNPVYIKERAKHRGSYPNVYTKGPGRWQVSLWSADKKPKELAQLYVDDQTGAVTAPWPG
jgi:hypothetical protein